MRALLSEIDPISAGDVVYPPGGRLGPRWQRDVQLVLVHEGSARIAVDGAERALLRAGAAGLLLPGHREEFWFATDAPTRHSWVQGRLAGDHGGRLAALPAALPASTALTELVREAVAVARAPLPTAGPLLAALGSAALWRYAGEAEARLRGPSEAVDRARRFLHDHVADPEIGLEDVARFAHVSPAHLVRRFRAELGTTPIAYLWQRRVATGADLLANTGLPVGEIAARTGFKSVYHFSRRVKVHTGASPTELRRESWISPRTG
jgi:AraC family transcriptional regulator of arabinose operon